MSESIKLIAEASVAIIEALGIFIITIIALHSILRAGLRLVRKEGMEIVFQELRQHLGQGILLGLELLIAADIIQTVAVKLTFETVGVLCVVVFIRTFLSFTLEVELTGKWPWQEKKSQEIQSTAKS